MSKLTKERFAVMNMVYQKYSFDYFLDSMERLEVKNFELWAGAPHFFNRIESLSDTKKLKKKIRERGFHVVCVTPEQVMYPYNIAASDAELRRESLDYFLKYIEQTAELEADKLLCCAGWGNYDEDFECAWKRAIEGLNIMTKRAEEVGIKLAFEILGPQESNLVHSFDMTKRMMGEIISPNFTLCVDTVPVKVDQRKLSEFFEVFGPRISHFHLTDGNPAGHVPCGTGCHDIAGYLDAIEKADYKGYITLEIGDTGCCVDPEGTTKCGLDNVMSLL